MVGEVLLYVSDNEVSKDMALYPGSRIEASGTLDTFSHPGNPGQFNEFSYYKSKKINYVMWAKEVRLLPEATGFKGVLAQINKRLFLLRERLNQVYYRILPEREAGTLSAMVLGEKSGLLTEVKETYQQAGLGHLLAISGLHISIAAMAVYQLVLFLKGSKRFAALLGIASLLFYGALTGFSVSASRAVLMLLLALVAGLCGRSYDRATALAFSGIWILAGQPGQLFQSGFLLSFGAVLGAGVVYPILEGFFLPENKEKSFVKKGKHWLMQAVLFQLSVSLVTTPVILWFYYEIPVYGMVLNIFLVPLMALVTGGGLVAGLVGLVFLPLGRFLVGGVWALLKLYERAAALSLSFPFSVWNPGQPKVWKLLFYGVVLCLLVYGLGKSKMRKKLLPAVLFALLFVLLLHPSGQEGVEVTFLDVGQGDGIFISCKEGISCLIDGGSSSEKEVGKYRLLPFLKYKGKSNPDYIFVTHTDADHINGIRTLVEEGRGGCLVLAKDLKGSQKAEELASLGEEKGMRIWWMQPGDSLKKGKFRLTCLAPDGIYNGENENAASLVLSLEYGSVSGLFTGDLEKEGEEALLCLPLSEYDFLKVAHHGSNYSTSSELLEKIKPKVSVISCGENNSYGHPGEELLERLLKSKSRIYQTQEEGAVTVESDGKRMTVKTYKR